MDRRGAARDLDAWLIKWQLVLRLRDWDVRIVLVRAFELDKEDQARVTWIRSQKQAKIRILDPVDYASEIGLPQDLEQSVVHELLHLHFACIDKFEGTDQTLHEQAIDAIAWALVKVDRGL